MWIYYYIHIHFLNLKGEYIMNKYVKVEDLIEEFEGMKDRKVLLSQGGSHPRRFIFTNCRMYYFCCDERQRNRR